MLLGCRKRSGAPLHAIGVLLDEVVHPDALNLHRELSRQERVLGAREATEAGAKAPHRIHAEVLRVRGDPVISLEVVWRCGGHLVALEQLAAEDETPAVGPPARLGGQEARLQQALLI